MIAKLKLFVLPIISLFMVCSCSQNETNLEGNRNKITIAFNAGDFKFNSTISSTESHLFPVKVFRGVTWGVLKTNLKKELINGDKSIFTFEPVAKAENVTFNKWTINSEDISDDYKFNEDVVIDADFTVKLSITLQVPSDYTIYDTTSGTATTKKEYNGVDKGSNLKKLLDDNGVEVRDSAGTLKVTNFNYFKDSQGIAIPKGSEENYKFTKEDTLTGVFSSKFTSSFQNDEWDIFLSAVNSGLEYIKTNDHGSASTACPGGYMSEYKANGNTFVGLKRSVKIGDISYPVTVIGEDIDDHGNQKCVLTFMFDNLVTTNRSFTSTSHPQDNSYQDSSLYDYLNNKFFYSLPAELQDSEKGIVRVDKYTNGGGGLDVNDNVTHRYKKTNDASHKLFVPSLAELNIQSYKDGYAPEGKSIVEDEGVGASHRYDSHYAYFNEDSTTKRIKKPLYLDSTGQQIEGDPTSYWVRSPDLTTSGCVWTVATDGNISGTPDDMSKTRGVCPCFSVGLEKSNINVTFNPGSGKWDDGTSNPITIDANENTYIDILVKLKAKSKNPTLSGQYFVNWYDDDGNIIDPTKDVTNVTSFTAQYTTETAHNITFPENYSTYKYRFVPTTFVCGSPVTINIFPIDYKNNAGENVRIRELPPYMYLTSGVTVLKQGTDFTYSYTDKQAGYATITVKASATKSLGNDIVIKPSNSTLMCDWATINEIATKDESNQVSNNGTPGAISKQYFDYCDKKDLTISGTKYTVEIIDLGDNTKDKIASTSVTPAITFDFMTLPNTTTKFNTAGENGNFDYASNSSNRTLYNAMDTLYNNAPSDFKTCVRNVTKHYVKPNSSEYKKPSDATFNQHFFAPAFRELSTDSPASSIDSDTGKDRVKNEGNQYHAYSKSGYDYENNISLKKTIVGTSTLANFYLRTGCYYQYQPFIKRKNARFQYYAYYNNGYIKYEANYSDTARYMLPLFCI